MTINNELNWLAISLVIEKANGDECQIAYTAKVICPRKGEYVWMPYNWDRKDEFGTRAFIVVDVAHHITDSNKGTYDSIIVYCEPVIPQQEQETPMPTIEELQHKVEFWQKSNQENYQRWKEANYELMQIKDKLNQKP